MCVLVSIFFDGHSWCPSTFNAAPSWQQVRQSAQQSQHHCRWRPPKEFVLKLETALTAMEGMEGPEVRAGHKRAQEAVQGALSTSKSKNANHSSQVLFHIWRSWTPKLRRIPVGTINQRGQKGREDFVPQCDEEMETQISKRPWHLDSSPRWPESLS